MGIHQIPPPGQKKVRHYSNYIKRQCIKYTCSQNTEVEILTQNTFNIRLEGRMDWLVIHHLNLWLMTCEKPKPKWVILHTMSTNATSFSKCREILIFHHLTLNLYPLCAKQWEVHLCENDGRMQTFFCLCAFFLQRLPVTATLVWNNFLTSGTMALFCLFWIIIVTNWVFKDNHFSPKNIWPKLKKHLEKSYCFEKRFLCIPLGSQFMVIT